MPYINAWNPNAPLGSADSGTIDDHIRLLRQQIEERMNTILDPSGQWADDPIVLLQAASLRTGLNITKGPYDIYHGDGTDSAQVGAATGVTDQYVGIVGDAYVNVPAQKGWKITKIEILLDPNGQNLGFTCYRTSFEGPTPVNTNISTASVTSGGSLIAVMSIFTGAEVVPDGALYKLFIDGPGAGQWRYYGMRVKYDDV